jgi:hypothetical protein
MKAHQLFIAFWAWEKSFGFDLRREMGVVAPPPGEAAADGLKPRVGGDGEHQALAQWMKEGTEPALAKAMSHGEPERQDDGDLDPKNRIAGKERQQKKRTQKNHGLEELKKNKRTPTAVEGGIEVFCESLPKIAEVVVHPATDEGDGMTGVGAVAV